MRFVFSSYIYTKDFNQPETWLKRTNAYGGILEALAQRHRVCCIEQIDYEGRHIHQDVEYHFERFSAFSRRFFPWSLHRKIKHFHPDVVIIHGLHFPLQVILLRLMLGNKVKILVQHHAEKPLKGIKKHMQQVADLFTDAYLFASQAIGREWIQAGNLATEKKIHEVMEVSSVFYPIDKGLARQITGMGGQPAFLWVGRLNENKDPLTVVKAFLQFQLEVPQAKLYMIFQTEELLPAIRQLLAHPAVNKESVQLIGKVVHDSLLYWFNSADFLLSASYYEGSGTAPCEALSCACIPILSDIAPFRMLTSNGSCGLLFRPGNEQSLLDVLGKANKLDLESLRIKCLDHFHQKLSFRAIARDIEAIVQSL